jgi:hypothetical protein
MPITAANSMARLLGKCFIDKVNARIKISLVDLSNFESSGKRYSVVKHQNKKIIPKKNKKKENIPDWDL